MPTILTVCNTCKRAEWDPEVTPATDGERLFEQISAHGAEFPNVKVRSHACLMGCDFGCNVTIQDSARNSGKLSYVLGQFEPEADAARAILEYAELHAQSDTGQVPFRSWPQGVKGHFRARIQPPGDDAE